MKMDYSVTRELSSKIPDRVPDRVSTQQIKAGLERIKKAQEQVLQQLKKNHMDYSIDVRTNTNSQQLRQKKNENEGLQKDLIIEREKSTEKSTLYRRRVVDLESSLAVHEQNQAKLRMENRSLEDQLRDLRHRYADLQRDYEKLVEESETSNRNLRNLEKQLMELVTKFQEEDPQKLRAQFEHINNERNSIMAQKVTLLKTNSKLESENIELKTKLTQLAQLKQKPVQSQQSGRSPSPFRSEDVNAILNQINKMNEAHEFIFNTIKSNTKLSRNLIDRENMYQNSLNRILEMFNVLQKGGIIQGGLLDYKFDHQSSFREEINRIQGEMARRHKKQISKFTAERQDLVNKNKSNEKQLEQLKQEINEKEEKITELRRQKSSLMQQISDLSAQISRIKDTAQKKDNKRIEQELKKQKSKDEEYRAIIQELNEQMITIQRQKKDLDGLIGKMTNNKSDEETKNRKKLSQIAEENQQIKDQNEKIKVKYEAIFVEKEHLYLSLNECQLKNSNLNKQLAREVLQKEKLIAELNKIRQQNEIGSAEVHKYKLLTENTKKECENVNNSYLLQIERLIKESLQLRQEIEILLQDRNELRELKGRYGLLMKDNQILGKKARHVNNQVDHLWMIKEVQYQNLNKVLTELRPL